jgi:hypothetical protein
MPFRKLITNVSMMYQRFQSLIMLVFVFGVVELFAYSDLVAVIFRLAEFVPWIIPVFIVVAILWGIYMIYKHKKKQKVNNGVPPTK